MPPDVIVFDTEFTAWKGSMERHWGGPAEYREIVQIGGISIDVETLAETGSFSVLIKPVMNPALSDYLMALTRITNERLAVEGTDFVSGVRAYLDFAAGRPMFCYGR